MNSTFSEGRKKHKKHKKLSKSKKHRKHKKKKETSESEEEDSDRGAEGDKNGAEEQIVDDFNQETDESKVDEFKKMWKEKVIDDSVDNMIGPVPLPKIVVGFTGEIECVAFVCSHISSLALS